MYGLTHNEIEDLRSVFVKFPQVEQAIIYGSRAKGNYRPGSDIDIALKGHNINLSVLANISSQLDDLSIPYRIDLFPLDKIKNQDLIEHINRVGKPL